MILAAIGGVAVLAAMAVFAFVVLAVIGFAVLDESPRDQQRRQQKARQIQLNGWWRDKQYSRCCDNPMHETMDDHIRGPSGRLPHQGGPF